MFSPDLSGSDGLPATKRYHGPLLVVRDPVHTCAVPAQRPQRAQRCLPGGFGDVGSAAIVQRIPAATDATCGSCVYLGFQGRNDEPAPVCSCRPRAPTVSLTATSVFTCNPETQLQGSGALIAFGADPPSFPVWKRGSIASEPHLASITTDYFIVDTASRPGMSGAPVIRRSWGFHILDDGNNLGGVPFATRFVGIYSGRLHTDDPGDAQIGMVWPGRIIEEIIAGRTRDQH